MNQLGFVSTDWRQHVMRDPRNAFYYSRSAMARRSFKCDLANDRDDIHNDVPRCNPARTSAREPALPTAAFAQSYCEQWFG